MALKHQNSKMLPNKFLRSDIFRKMPIKHLRSGYFVTRFKFTIFYPLIITLKRRRIENFHQFLPLLFEPLEHTDSVDVEMKFVVCGVALDLYLGV